MSKTATKQIELFCAKGMAYRDFLQLAAQPLIFSSDLLYKLWFNFRAQTGKTPNEQPPYLVVSDLILSSLCQPIGVDLYKLEEDIRTILLTDLDKNTQKDIAFFVEEYATHQKANLSQNIYEIYRIWAAGVLRPKEMEQTIIDKLQSDIGDYEKVGYLSLYFGSLETKKEGMEQTSIMLQIANNSTESNVLNIPIPQRLLTLANLAPDNRIFLGQKRSKLLLAWEQIKDSYENGTIVKGTTISRTKGGLIVDIMGLETFLPDSQIDIKPIVDYDSYIGKRMEFKVVKINETIKNAVVSHKVLIESDLAEQREAIITGLERGQVLEGLVKNITDFGAFLDLGGVDGLLYITDISWGRITHPNEVLKINDKINVVVLDFDENKKRISLGLKQLQLHPWDVLNAEITEGSVVKGKIVNIEDYGAFIEIEPGVEGLVHVSEVTWSHQLINAKDYFNLGQEYEAKVVTIDREERKMSLSLKQLNDDPWSKIEERYPLESRHTGRVMNLTPYGIFAELEEGIGGMIHISDLSWTKRYSHPSEFTKVGKDIELVILEIDKGSRKLTLGHKQIEENPWDTFANVFLEGSYHDATLIRKDDRGAIVQLPYGLEAFAPIKHIRKEDGNNAKVNEVIKVKILEFNRDDKRILVSHLRYLEDTQREIEEKTNHEYLAERQKTRDRIKKIQTDIEYSTLGDIDSLRQLKGQLKNTAEQDELDYSNYQKIKSLVANAEIADALALLLDISTKNNIELNHDVRNQQLILKSLQSRFREIEDYSAVEKEWIKVVQTTLDILYYIFDYNQ
ncbi:MAG: 30S ribosomal protein S1 [Bacteroidota bacterium]